MPTDKELWESACKMSKSWAEVSRIITDEDAADDLYSAGLECGSVDDPIGLCANAVVATTIALASDLTFEQIKTKVDNLDSALAARCGKRVNYREGNSIAEFLAFSVYTMLKISLEIEIGAISLLDDLVVCARRFLFNAIGGDAVVLASARQLYVDASIALSLAFGADKERLSKDITKLADVIESKLKNSVGLEAKVALQELLDDSKDDCAKRMSLVFASYRVACAYGTISIEDQRAVMEFVKNDKNNRWAGALSLSQFYPGDSMKN